MIEDLETEEPFDSYLKVTEIVEKEAWKRRYEVDTESIDENSETFY